LKLDGVIDSHLVAEGTRALDPEERREFEQRYLKIKEAIAAKTDPVWVSH
jgi:hypothetical protein